MFLVIALMFGGLAAGYLLYRLSHTWLFIHQLITLFIWMLLFLLGIEVGGNPDIVKALPVLGLFSVSLTLFALLGSSVFAWALWRWISRDKPIENESETIGLSAANQSSPLKGSLIIIGFFFVGALLGYKGFLLSLAQSQWTFVVLCALMCSVGFSMGNAPSTLARFKTLPPRLFLLPFATIIGTLAGCLLYAGLFRHHAWSDCLAVGSGFGYYSLSSIFITQYRGAELGTVALLSNLTRELVTLVAAPLMVRCFGRLAPISAGGATTMDTTLPIITRCAGQEFVVLSLFHGFVVDFSVPFLVTFFCSFN